MKHSLIKSLVFDKNTQFIKNLFNQFFSVSNKANSYPRTIMSDKFYSCKTDSSNGNMVHEKKDFSEILKYLIKMNQSSNRKLRICIEGNIASGKTTIIKYLKEVVENSNRKSLVSTNYNFDENSSEINLIDNVDVLSKRIHVKIIPEPVDLWRNLNGNNLLELMYKDSERWALAFHSYVQLTMLENHLRLNELTNPPMTSSNVLSPSKCLSNNQLNQAHTHKMLITSPTKQKQNKDNIENCSPNSGSMNINIMERSLFSAKYCFVENVYRAKIIKQLEYEILDKWFNWMKEAHDCNLDVIFYLRTKPETCMQRLNNRGRPEETSTITLEYLRNLHDLHEQWLNNRDASTTNMYRPAKVIIIDADQSIDNVYKSMEIETKNCVSLRV